MITQHKDEGTSVSWELNAKSVYRHRLNGLQLFPWPRRIDCDATCQSVTQL